LEIAFLDEPMRFQSGALEALQEAYVKNLTIDFNPLNLSLLQR
jgi:hypothetical protein